MDKGCPLFPLCPVFVLSYIGSSFIFTRRFWEWFWYRHRTLLRTAKKRISQNETEIFYLGMFWLNSELNRKWNSWDILSLWIEGIEVDYTAEGVWDIYVDVLILLLQWKIATIEIHYNCCESKLTTVLSERANDIFQPPFRVFHTQNIDFAAKTLCQGFVRCGWCIKKEPFTENWNITHSRKIS